MSSTPPPPPCTLRHNSNFARAAALCIPRPSAGSGGGTVRHSKRGAVPFSPRELFTLCFFSAWLIYLFPGYLFFNSSLFGNSVFGNSIYIALFLFLFLFFNLFNNAPRNNAPLNNYTMPEKAIHKTRRNLWPQLLTRHRKCFTVFARGCTRIICPA
jgi:hypothetical protein